MEKTSYYLRLVSRIEAELRQHHNYLTRSEREVMMETLARIDNPTHLGSLYDSTHCDSSFMMGKTIR